MNPDYGFILIIAAIISATIILKQHFRAKVRATRLTAWPAN